MDNCPAWGGGKWECFLNSVTGQYVITVWFAYHDAVIINCVWLENLLI